MGIREPTQYSENLTYYTVLAGYVNNMAAQLGVFLSFQTFDVAAVFSRSLIMLT